MSVAVLSSTCGKPADVQYAADVASGKRIGLEEARKHLAERLRLAKNGEPSFITRHGKLEAAIVSMEFVRRATEALGEPLDIIDPE